MPRRWINSRVMVRVSGLLLLGAIITVAAAWGPAVWFGLQSGRTLEESVPTEEQVRWWKATVSPAVDDEPRVTAAFFMIGFDSEVMNTSTSRMSLLGTPAYRLRSGLPLRSLGFSTWSTNPRSINKSEWHSTWRWVIPLHFGLRRGTVELPLTPIWPGFVVDTLFFAALSAVILAGWRWMVRRWRLARGRCPACAYPIGTSPVCTECGGVLPVIVAPTS